MQDIRKPYSHSKSKKSIASRAEEYERNSYQSSYDEDSGENYNEEPVQIPTRRRFKERRNIDSMEMYPSRRAERDYEENDTEPQGRDYGDEIVYRDPRTRYVRRHNTFGTYAFVAVFALFVGGALLLTFVFNRATVTVTPKYTDVYDFHQTVAFADPSNDTDATVLFTLATTSLSKSKTLTLSDAKAVQAKASGKIVIYNNDSASPQKLIKNTRFESSAGKIYRIAQSVTVPGKTGTTPGSVEAIIFADSYGADYNSSPVDFTVPGFKGTPRYQTFYARSNGPITGGASGSVSLASLSDINAAKDELALELAQELKASLSTIKVAGFVPLASAIDVTYVDNEDALLQGTTSTYKVTATGYLMLAKASELAREVAKTTRDYNGAPVRLDYADTLTFTRKDVDRIASTSVMSILVEGNPRVVFTTDIDKLKAVLVGERRANFTTIMKSIDSIQGASISFSPMWLSTFPQEASKISVVESLPKR